MKSTREILVTTTSSVDGVNVMEYLKPLSAHIVAGTDFFSDFFASFSDIFGGRSQTYQRQLSSIYSEAIEALKRSAYEIGANCILGLKVDMDEISGKNKSMFMITAIGTAAIVDFSSTTKQQDNNLDVISADLMKDLRRKEQIIKLAQSEKLLLDDSTWNFVTNNRIDEIAKEILMDIRKDFSYYDSDKKSLIFKRLVSYFSSINEELSSKVLYNFYVNEHSENFATYLYNLIKELTIFKVDAIGIYLKDNDLKVQKRALNLAVIDKPYFSLDDIPDYIKLRDLIKSSFKENGEVVSIKSKLSSKEKEVWKCNCGKTNNVNDTSCDCGQDRMGFLYWELKTEKAIEIIDDNINLIQRTLNKK